MVISVPLRILQVTNAYPPSFVGGAELVAHEHAVALRDMGHACHVLTADTIPHSHAFQVSYTQHEQIPVCRVRVPPSSFSWRNANFKNAHVEKAFSSLLLSLKPQLLHFHNLPGLSVNLIRLAKNAGIPTILTAHDYWGFCHRQTLTRPNGELCSDFSECSRCLSTYVDSEGEKRPISERNIYVKTRLRELDVMLAPSDYLAAQYRHADAAPERLLVVSNGVNLQRFSPPPKGLTTGELLVFGVASHLGKHKGIAELLKAIGRLPRNSPARFDIAGSGPLEGKIRFFTKWHRNGHMVRFVGSISPDQMKSFYAGLDVFICASNWPENQPRTIMEAMACGLPVIATNLGGCPELVQNGVTGLLVPPNDPLSLADALKSYLADPSKTRTHGLAGREFIESHDMKKTINQLLALYSELVG